MLLDLSGQINQIKQRYTNFSYVPNFKVKTFSETEDNVILLGVDQAGKPLFMEAEKLFLACGPLATGKIVLDSQQEINELDILDSQYFIIPFLSLKPLITDAELKNYHSSCQLMAEHMDDFSAPHRTHLQYYFYNEIYERIFFHKLPLLKPFRSALMLLFRRLGVVQGFLHSDLSATMKLRKIQNDAFELSQSKKAPNIMKIIRSILWKLLKAGLIPILPALQVKLPGQSFHNGGSFPMQSVGGFLTTEPNGKLRGFSRTFIADSSTFPSIPATTITLTIMANAYRVGDINA